MAGVLMAWEDAASLTERFEHVHEFISGTLPRRRDLGATYQGYVKALERHGLGLVERVKLHLREQSAARLTRWTRRLGLEAVAIDGSRFDAPRTIDNEAELGIAGHAGTHPQMSVTTAWHMGSGLPWDWRVGPGREAEREHLRDMLPDLPPGCLIVADAGFTGYDLLRTILQSGRDILVRVGGNVTLLTDGTPHVQVRQAGGRVLLWPRRQPQQPPLTLRLIVVGSGRKKVHLLTSITDPRKLSRRAAGTLYRMRWGVEVFYRQAKQTLERRGMRSGNPRRAVLEMHWTLLGLMLLMLMNASALSRVGVDPLHISVAAALRSVRGLSRRADRRGGAASLRTRLGRCIKDGYRRRGEKTSFDWPYKKTLSPPAPPHLRKARRSQLQQAARPARSNR